jgi:hypothetical protein
MAIMAFIHIITMLPTTLKTVTTTFVALLVITMPAALTIHMTHVAREAPTPTMQEEREERGVLLRLL